MLSTMGLCHNQPPQVTPLEGCTNQVKIAWLNLSPSSEERAGGNGVYTTLPSLLNAPTADVLVIDGTSDRISEALWCLRNNSDYAESLIFLKKDAGALPGALADGLLPREITTIQQQWQRWQKLRRQRPRINPEQNPMHRLDHWLWLRPDGWIQPIGDPSHPSLYRYPLLDILTQEWADEVQSWLTHRFSEGYYDRGPLVDRIRLCRSCNSGHLNYVDICGQCHSLEIARQPCLHCFNCGHVAPQEEFRRNSTLLCTNCLTQLRHIGCDYDRPLENYRCWDCKSLFIDATVEARCLNCGSHHKPEELAVREIRPIRLSDKGRISLVNQGNHTTQQSTIGLESSTVLSEIEFNNLLDWQISILRKDNQYNSQSAPPALVAIWKTEGELYPEDDTNLRQEDWINTLLERLDETDRVTCSGQRLLWILRPQCNNEELTNLIRQCKKHLSFLPSRGDQHYTIEGRLLNDQQSRLGDALTLKNRILACLANPAGDEH